MSNADTAENAPNTHDDQELTRKLSGTLIRLRSRFPFFAALALFARTVLRDDIATAATDGRDIFWNRDFLRSLNASETGGVLLHEVLHAALLHVARRGERDPILWNIAADIVVNGIIASETQTGATGQAFTLPNGTIRDEALEKFSVEEVYSLLQKNPHQLPSAWQDLLGEGWGEIGIDRAQLEAHWRTARAQASTLLHASGQGTLPAELMRELSALEPSRIDWRSRLWRFMVQTPTDFSGFDRRFIGRGLYLEDLNGQSLRVSVAVDTSGSISNKELGQFLGEVQGILRAYPHIVCDLWYADAKAHGPYPLQSDTDIAHFPRPVGGGGTDFCPFFEAIAQAEQESPNAASTEQTLCIYFTDGYGTFPKPAPTHPTLWVVLPGGLSLEAFPFGETVCFV